MTLCLLMANVPSARNSLKLLSLAIALAVAPSVRADTTAINPIAGVVTEGTKVELIKDGFEGTEGPLALPDGSLIFTETRANRITQIAPDGSVHPFLDNTNGANGLAFNKQGEIVAVQVLKPQLGVIYPTNKAKNWVGEFEGKAFQRPNDLTINKRGGIYFTDIGVVPKEPNGEAARPGVFYLTPDGAIKRVISNIERPNGVILSADEKTLYVANTAGEYVLAYPVINDGRLGPAREFAKLGGYEKNEQGVLSSGADGLAIDNRGRLYVASNLGVQVFDAKGRALGTIALPQKPQNLAFAGKDKKTLYVVGRGAAYKIAVQTPGYLGRAK
ncbi:MAG TPA: SMP-30/gluconolactonase/LRE family protein [Cellvibrionaceae bacterium]